ncbi:MAG: GntR family transcriptional regulator [Dehalobacterium sp.]
MNEVLYLSIVKKIKERILKGHYKPGDMLDSESSLMKEFQASRMTIRKSLSLLSNEGYVYSVPGKGNFVCTPETDLFQFRFSKYDDLLVPIDEVKLLSVKVKEVNTQMADRLSLTSSDKIIEVSRLLSSAGAPVALEFIFFKYIPNQPVVEDRLKFANHLERLERTLAFAIQKTMEVGALKADESVSRRLNCPEGDVVFCLEETVFNSESNSVISYTLFYVRPNNIVIKAATPKEEYNGKRIF